MRPARSFQDQGSQNCPPSGHRGGARTGLGNENDSLVHALKKTFSIHAPVLLYSTSKGFCDVYIRKGKRKVERKVERKPKGQSNFDGTEADVVFTVGDLILKGPQVLRDGGTFWFWSGV